MESKLQGLSCTELHQMVQRHVQQQQQGGAPESTTEEIHACCVSLRVLSERHIAKYKSRLDVVRLGSSLAASLHQRQKHRESVHVGLHVFLDLLPLACGDSETSTKRTSQGLKAVPTNTITAESARPSSQGRTSGGLKTAQKAPLHSSLFFLEMMPPDELRLVIRGLVAPLSSAMLLRDEKSIEQLQMVCFATLDAISPPAVAAVVGEALSDELSDAMGRIALFALAHSAEQPVACVGLMTQFLTQSPRATNLVLACLSRRPTGAHLEACACRATLALANAASSAERTGTAFSLQTWHDGSACILDDGAEVCGAPSASLHSLLQHLSSPAASAAAARLDVEQHVLAMLDLARLVCGCEPRTRCGGAEEADKVASLLRAGDVFSTVSGVKPKVSDEGRRVLDAIAPSLFHLAGLAFDFGELRTALAALSVCRVAHWANGRPADVTRTAVMQIYCCSCDARTLAVAPLALSGLQSVTDRVFRTWASGVTDRSRKLSSLTELVNDADVSPWMLFNMLLTDMNGGASPADDRHPKLWVSELLRLTDMGAQAAVSHMTVSFDLSSFVTMHCASALGLTYTGDLSAAQFARRAAATACAGTPKALTPRNVLAIGLAQSVICVGLAKRGVHGSVPQEARRCIETWPALLKHPSSLLPPVFRRVLQHALHSSELSRSLLGRRTQDLHPAPPAPAASSEDVWYPSDQERAGGATLSGSPVSVAASIGISFVRRQNLWRQRSVWGPAAVKNGDGLDWLRPDLQLVCLRVSHDGSALHLSRFSRASSQSATLPLLVDRVNSLRECQRELQSICEAHAAHMEATQKMLSTGSTDIDDRPVRHETKSIYARKASTNEKSDWWAARHELDRRVGTLVDYMDASLLGTLGLALLAGTPLDTGLREAAFRAATHLYESVRDRYGAADWDSTSSGEETLKRTLSSLMEALPLMPWLRLTPPSWEPTPSLELTEAVSFIMGVEISVLDSEDVDAFSELCRAAASEVLQALLEHLPNERDAEESYLQRQVSGCRSRRAQLRRSIPRRHVLLCLDGAALEALPWESTAALASLKCSRVPSVDYAMDSLTSNGRPTASRRPISPGRVVALVNPDGDQPKSCRRFRPLAESFKWQYYEGVPPIKSKQLAAAALDGAAVDLMIYIGHSDGTRWIPRRSIFNCRRSDKNCCPAVLLMGCSSAYGANRLCDPFSTVESYLASGAPAVVACLWDVTDGDLDKLTRAALEIFFGTASDRHSDEEGRLSTMLRRSACIAERGATEGFDPSQPTLLDAFTKAKSDGRCRLPFFTGAAVVTFGVPTESLQLATSPRD